MKKLIFLFLISLLSAKLLAVDAYLGGINGGYAMGKIKNAVVGLADEVQTDPAIKIYPNPAKTDAFISIQLSNFFTYKNEKLKITVKNITGMIVFETYLFINGNSVELDLSSNKLIPAYYIISLNIDNEKYYEKLIITD